MIRSVRSMRLVIPLLSFLLIWRATHTGVSARARLRGVSPSLFMMSMSAPLDRNSLKTNHVSIPSEVNASLPPLPVKMCLDFDLRDTFQVALPGGDVQRRVSVHVNCSERAASVQHQLCYIHTPCIRRPVETHIHLLKRNTGLK